MFKIDRHDDLPDLLLSICTGAVAGFFLWQILHSVYPGLVLFVLSIAAALLRIRKRHEQD